MIRRPPRSTLSSSSAASDVYKRQGHIIIANIGDSRSVLATGGKTVPMSFDHKPTNAGEQKRIEDAGGSVTLGRVNGDLAVSRALGDFCLLYTSPSPRDS
eukprot:TRINITY_DN16388_c0_g1_i5.p1 TRINITY_DN16388_c0_g1~~TRINITY_DN16388_c0_g1_i5.p1  ORF type:complete len:100 (-),score=31.69 TRINITY_DN16388_c0_g1_i5:104-403(-)